MSAIYAVRVCAWIMPFGFLKSYPITAFVAQKTIHAQGNMQIFNLRVLIYAATALALATPIFGQQVCHPHPALAKRPTDLREQSR